MLVQINNLKLPVTALLIAGLMAGCSDSDLNSSFVFSDATESLINVKLEKGWGIVPELNSWSTNGSAIRSTCKCGANCHLKLGGVFGRVSAAPDASGAVKELVCFV